MQICKLFLLYPFLFNSIQKCIIYTILYIHVQIIHLLTKPIILKFLILQINSILSITGNTSLIGILWF